MNDEVAPKPQKQKSGIGIIGILIILIISFWFNVYFDVLLSKQKPFVQIVNAIPKHRLLLKNKRLLEQIALKEGEISVLQDKHSEDISNLQKQVKGAEEDRRKITESNTNLTEANKNITEANKNITEGNTQRQKDWSEEKKRLNKKIKDLENEIEVLRKNL